MKHFALTSNNGTFVFGVGKFHNLQQLVDHFQNYPIIGGETGLLVEHIICICVYWFHKISIPIMNTRKLSVEISIGRRSEKSNFEREIILWLARRNSIHVLSV